MPYYKGVHFEQAFHTEEDVLKHNEENPADAQESVVTAPVAEAALVAEEALETIEEKDDFAVPVDEQPVEDDRLTPIVDLSHVSPDPFPSFPGDEKDPETQPQPDSDPAPSPKTEVSGGPNTVETTPDSPDAKKKKKSGRGA